MTAKLPSFLQGFRLVTGDALNAIIDAVNGLTGNGTASAISATTLTLSGGVVTPPTALTTNGAIAPHTAATYVITKAGVLADTLAAPTAGTDDGLEIVITSGTANAHTLTATGLLNTGSASVNVATFAAFAGAGITLMAYNGKWNVVASVGITFS
jgi:hypothetical protein